MRGLRGCIIWLVLLVASAVARPASAQVRSLYWRELAVQASLDREGRLHVHERHVMVFSGDWNGGERRIRLGGDQALELRSLTRFAPDGRAVALVEGDLSATDQYAVSSSKSLDSKTLRWRSRQPHEPAFDRTELVYVISYVLSNVLLEGEDGAYLLNHDFAFPDRPGMIEHFTLELELAPVWSTLEPAPVRVAHGPIPPGVGAVTRLDLRYGGQGRPAGVIDIAPPALRLTAGAALLGFVAWLLLRLFRRERALGRFAPLVPIESIDERWLTQHVLCLSPELVGTIFNRHVSSTEVAAVIARMVLEGKLASRVAPSSAHAGEDNLELWLLVERATLGGYERELVDQLFFSGNATSTDAVREHYASVGFYPVKLLRAPLQKQADERLGTRARPLWSLLAIVLGFVLSGVGLVAMVVSRWTLFFAAVSASVLGIVGVTFCGILAHAWAADVERLAPAARKVLVLLGLTVLAWLVAFFALESLSSLGVASFALLGGTSAALVTRLASSREEHWGMALRKHVTAARRYFEHELERPQPRLRDEWYPYLIALGLLRHMAQWLGAFGARDHRDDTDSDRLSSSSSGSSRSSTSGSTSASPAGSWTGGGGAFGGAGASGSWVTAAGALTTGVSSASHGSSGSSSSSSSSGGSSSGGGGGGGW